MPQSAPDFFADPWDIDWKRPYSQSANGNDTRSSACKKKYNELLVEWRRLSSDTSIEWAKQLEDKLEGDGAVDDFLEWMKEQLRPEDEVPDFDRLDPGTFERLLAHANWKDGDKASQLITSRLWYGKVNKQPEFVIGWVHPENGWAEEGLLALRLNAHDLSPKETDYGLCYDLQIEALLPHIFVGMRYLPDSGQASPVDKCLLLLGDLFILPSRKSSPTCGRSNTRSFEGLKYLLALQLNSPDKDFILLPNPGNVGASDEELPIGRFEVRNERWIHEHCLVTNTLRDLNFLPDPLKTDGFDYEIHLGRGIFDLKLEKLSSKEPKLGEVGLSKSLHRFVAMFPPL